MHTPDSCRRSDDILQNFSEKMHMLSRTCPKCRSKLYYCVDFNAVCCLLCNEWENSGQHADGILKLPESPQAALRSSFAEGLNLRQEMR